jgi:Skp family chaperone for outer membrane proteins
MMRRRVLAVIVAGVLAAVPALALAQQPATQAPLLTLDEERLFAESRFGKALIAAQEADTQALIAENREIEAGLEAEERDLTERRAGMTKAAFDPLAQAFNDKVESIRKAQKAKSDVLTRRFEDERRRFFETASPVLAQILTERGAVAIISKRAVIAGFDNIDITEAAIARLDQVLGDGGVRPPQPVPATP